MYSLTKTYRFYIQVFVSSIARIAEQEVRWCEGTLLVSFTQLLHNIFTVEIKLFIDLLTKCDITLVVSQKYL